MSHSLKVAQVGRRNTERLQGLVARGEITGAAKTLVESLDPDSIEASCLAHDLGHPPFGHIAEEVLNQRSQGITDGFEGNAQSFRIVSRLAVRTRVGGLDLTRQTLDGMLKYPWAHHPTDADADGKRSRKWGHYADDREAFAFAREDWPEEERKNLPELCLAAEIMEWADDLTYAVHDLDDFFRAGLIPLDRLAIPGGVESKRLVDLLQDAKEDAAQAFPKCEITDLVDIIQQTLTYGPGAPYEHTQAARADLRGFGSKLITRYLDAFMVEMDGDEIKLKIDPAAQLEVTALSLLVRVYVIRRPGLAVVQHGQQRMMRELFDFYFDASEAGDKGDRRLFPPSAKERLIKSENGADRARVVIDLLSGLTESSAVQLHRRLLGGNIDPTLDATALIG